MQKKTKKKKQRENVSQLEVVTFCSMCTTCCMGGTIQIYKARKKMKHAKLPNTRSTLF